MAQSISSITTIKLTSATKARIDKLRVYSKETYDEVLQRMLFIMNLCKLNPLKAQAKLKAIDRAHKASLFK